MGRIKCKQSTSFKLYDALINNRLLCCQDHAILVHSRHFNCNNEGWLWKGSICFFI